jgi:hypothetical protein
MIDKDAIYHKVCSRFASWYSELTPGTGACLYWMQAGYIELQKAGLDPIIQAGTANWRMLPHALDHGHEDTHFGFEWEPSDPKSVAARKADLLPEIHCWCAVRSTQEIVDFSTATLPDVCRRMGFVWKMPPPPSFVWARFDALPDGMVYRADIEAIKFLLDFMARKFTTSMKEPTL